VIDFKKSWKGTNKIDNSRLIYKDYVKAHSILIGNSYILQM